MSPVLCVCLCRRDRGKTIKELCSREKKADRKRRKWKETELIREATLLVVFSKEISVGDTVVGVKRLGPSKEKNGAILSAVWALLQTVGT